MLASARRARARVRVLQVLAFLLYLSSFEGDIVESLQALTAQLRTSPFPSLPLPSPDCASVTPAAPPPLSLYSLCFFFREALYIHLAICRRLFVVRAIVILLLLAHVVEALYAYTRAQRAGHKDTAPLWFIQTVIIGFPSTRLVMRLLS